jgi:selenocysteine-specific elongation factor
MTTPHDLVLGTAGHIDHGKTALVRVLTGVDTDRLPDEKRRGITIDLGFAALDLGDGRRLALIDVPGHERFVHNMLAGATGLDLALLVVAADDSVMPQTREHLEILQLLGIPAGVVALTKCDLVESGWQAMVEEEVRELTRGTFLQGAPIIPTSAATGQGIEALRSALRRLADQAPARDDPGAFRLAIDRAFTVAGHGAVVTGTVTSGSVAVGDELELLPAGRTVRVRGLQQHERPVERLGRGARAAINLAGIRHDDLRRGDVLATPGYLRPSNVLGVTLRPTPGAPRPLRNGGRYRLHLGTADLPARLALFDPAPPKPGETVFAQLVLGEPAAAVHGQPFVLREESPPATLGGGRVVRPTGRRIRRRDAAARDRLQRLAGPEPIERARAALALAGLELLSPLDLAREAGLVANDAPRVLDELARGGAVVELSVGRRTVRLAAERLVELEGRVLRTLERLHAAHPRQAAIRRAHVAAGLPDLGIDGLPGALLERLAARGEVIADARTVALKSFEPKLSQAERKLKAEIAEAYRAGGFSPPEAAELASQAGARGAVVPELVALLAAEGRVVEITPQLALDAEAEAELRRRVTRRLADGSSMTMADLRDLLGTTRKYAVPIGEYLDRIGLTRREGDLRRLGEAASRGGREDADSPQRHGVHEG